MPVRCSAFRAFYVGAACLARTRACTYSCPSRCLLSCIVEDSFPSARSMQGFFVRDITSKTFRVPIIGVLEELYRVVSPYRCVVSRLPGASSRGLFIVFLGYLLHAGLYHLLGIPASRKALPSFWDTCFAQDSPCLLCIVTSKGPEAKGFDKFRWLHCWRAD